MLTNHFINFPYHCFCRLRFVQFFIILFSLEEGRVLGGLSIPRSVNFLLKSIDPPISPQDSGCPIFIFFIKQYWIYTRHHAEPNINILLLTDWLSFDVQGLGGGRISDVDGQGVGVLKIGQFSWTSYKYHPF